MDTKLSDGRNPKLKDLMPDSSSRASGQLTRSDATEEGTQMRPGARYDSAAALSCPCHSIDTLPAYGAVRSIIRGAVSSARLVRPAWLVARTTARYSPP